MNSLRGRLILIFLVVALSAVAVVGLFAVDRSREAIIDTAWKEGQALASALSIKMDAYLRERALIIETQAERHVVRSMNWDEQESSLAPLYERYAFAEIFVADADGAVRFVKRDTQGTNIRDRDYFIQVLKEKKSVVSNPVAHRVTGKLIFVYASPIMRDGKVVGVLAATESLETISKEVASVVWGTSGYAYLADRTGLTVAHPVADVVAKVNLSVESDRVAPELARAMREGLAGRSGTVEYFFNGRDQMNAYAPVPFTGWLAAVTTPQQEFLAPVRLLRNVILVISALLAFFIVLIALWLANSIAKPIRIVAEKMEEVAKGDLTSTIDLKSNLKEVRLLVQAINSMVTLVSGSIGEILESSHSVLARAEDMSAAAEESTASIEEVLAITERTSTETQSAAASLEETNAGVEEIAAGAQAGAKAAAEAGEEAVIIADAAQKGGDAMQLIASMIIETAKAGEQVGNAVENLSVTVKNISGFVNMITSIADQTNLLALNAAIEAARAGEAGRGFAVVAEEVRKLAEESNRAAGEVGRLIGEISTRTGSALKDSENSSKILKELVGKASETSAVISDVVKRMNNVTESIQTIAATIEEQSASTEEMTAGMDSASKSSIDIAEQVGGIARSMQEQSKVVESIASASQELVNLSAAMQQAVSRFKLKGQAGGLVPKK
jgi:methyl-accepting chemotaxis protein